MARVLRLVFDLVTLISSLERGRSITALIEETSAASACSVPRDAPSVGDVYEIPSRHGVVYLQVTHHTALSHFLGSVVRVVRGLHRERIRGAAQAEGETTFFTLVDVARAVGENAMQKVATASVPPSAAVFPGFRYRSGVDSDGATVWAPWNGGTEPLDALGSTLSPAEQAISILETLSASVIVERLRRDWRPEKET